MKKVLVLFLLLGSCNTSIKKNQDIEIKEVKKTKTTEKIISLLNVDCEVYDVTDKNINTRFESLLNDGLVNNVYPVIIISSEELLETLQYESTYDEVISNEVDVNEIVKKNFIDIEDYEDSQFGTGLVELKNVYKNIYLENNQVIIAKYKTDKPWEIISDFDIFNDFEMNMSERIAFLKKWYFEYRTIIGVISYDSLTLKVLNPTNNSTKIDNLLKEHYVFNTILYDVPIKKYKNFLNKSLIWSFWFD